jgi:hypothetical protein
LLGSDDLVVALIEVAFVVKQTGISVEEENEVHSWHFDADGKVARFCHELDTYQHRAAFKGVHIGDDDPCSPWSSRGVPPGDDLVVKLDVDPRAVFKV